jgi:hypothetical protein
MHPRRLIFLSYRHAQRRAVVERNIRPDGTTFTLECGHTHDGAAHFDSKLTTHCNCMECGKEYVKASPLYAKEWL